MRAPRIKTNLSLMWWDDGWSDDQPVTSSHNYSGPNRQEEETDKEVLHTATAFFVMVW
jgi:type 1 glutamine amidotransferase